MWAVERIAGGYIGKAHVSCSWRQPHTVSSTKKCQITGILVLLPTGVIKCESESVPYLVLYSVYPLCHHAAFVFFILFLFYHFVGPPLASITSLQRCGIVCIKSLISTSVIDS